MTMTSDSWFGTLLRTVRKPVLVSEKLMLGVLAHEVSNFMMKLVHLWECLSDEQVVRVREEILNSVGIKKLVSEDQDFLQGLICGEMIHNLNSLAAFVARLGKRCRDPVWHAFEHVFDRLVRNNVDVHGWEYGSKKMDWKVRKMTRFIAMHTSLSKEQEMLRQLEQVLRRMQRGYDPNRIGFLQYKHRVIWQRQEVQNLRESSLCNRTYDYTARLLARSLFTIFVRIKHVFGPHLVEALVGNVNHDVCLPRSHSASPSMNNLPRFSSTPPAGKKFTKSGSVSSKNKIGATNSTRSKPPHKLKGLRTVGPFKGCMISASDSPIINGFNPVSGDHMRSNSVNPRHINGAKTVEPLNYYNILHTNLPLIGSNPNVLNVLPSTLGGAALAVHYASIVIFIEKLVSSPHMIESDARDDLYSMLPTSLRMALRARLKSHTNNLKSVVYKTDLAAKWSKTLDRILEWLLPLARSMIGWQSERNFEHQHLIFRTNVLLVQTLYFADQVKTEAAITELLVGLNYLWRFHQINDAEAG